jgi:hypothetical protein
MFKDPLDTPQSLDHVSAVVVQVPEFAVVLLMSPPEGVLFENLVLFEVLSNSPTLVIGESQAVFLEESVDSRDTSVPRVL